MIDDRWWRKFWWRWGAEITMILCVAVMMALAYIFGRVSFPK